MARRHVSRLAEWYKDVGALDPDEWAFAFRLGTAAAHFTAVVDNPETYRGLIPSNDPPGEEGIVDALQDLGFINIVKRSAGRRTIQFADNSFNRFAAAITKEFREPDKRISILGRFLAFLQLTQDPGFRRWTKPHPEDAKCMMIHPAVFEVSATMPLAKGGRFPATAFFRRVESVAREKFPDDPPIT